MPHGFPVDLWMKFYFLPIKSTASKAAIAESASTAGVFDVAVVGDAVGFAVVAAGGIVVGFAVVVAGVYQAEVSNTNPLSEPPLP